MSLDLTTQFAEQVTVNQLVQNVVYASGAISALFVVVGLLLIDVGAADGGVDSTPPLKNWSASSLALPPSF